MSGQISQIAGHPVFVCGARGPVLTELAVLSDLIGEVFSTQAAMVVLPLSRLGPDFLDLSSGVAGALLQKFINYRFRVVIVGDTKAAEARSKPLRDFINETNRGLDVWFCPDMAALAVRLGTKATEAAAPACSHRIWA